MIGSAEPEICTKILRNLSGNLRAKFPVNTRGCSMANIARLDYALSEFSEGEANLGERQSLQQNDKKRRKRKVRK